MKALVAIGIGAAVLGVGAAVAFASSSKKKHTHLDGPVAFPQSAIDAAPELGLGHASVQTDSTGTRWVVAIFPDTGNPDTVVTIAALESPAGPWVRFVQNNKTHARTLQEISTAGMPVDPAAMKKSWGL